MEHSIINTENNNNDFASVRNLCTSYGKKQVLFNIEINNIKPGELIGLIGPNASGKSTLFNSLAGLLPSTGDITIDGKQLRSTPHALWSRVVGMMPQQYDINIALTVFDSILLSLKSHGGWRVDSDDLNAVEEIVDTLHLHKITNSKLYELSGGQKQMVSMARILVRKPPMILLDEPTSALDLHHQLSSMHAIKNLTRKQPIASIIALHDLNLASNFCDRLLLIREGEILLDGTPSEVLSSPQVGETYGVNINLERTQRNALYVDAFLD